MSVMVAFIPAETNWEFLNIRQNIWSRDTTSTATFWFSCRRLTCLAACVQKNQHFRFRYVLVLVHSNLRTDTHIHTFAEELLQAMQ